MRAVLIDSQHMVRFILDASASHASILAQEMTEVFEECGWLINGRAFATAITAFTPPLQLPPTGVAVDGADRMNLATRAVIRALGAAEIPFNVIRLPIAKADDEVVILISRPTDA